MINKNVTLRLEDIDDLLYYKDDINGYAMYFIDKELTKGYSGEIYSIFKGRIESEAQYINGSKNGLEYIYNSNGDLEQINECRGNVLFGVSKEYDEKGNIKTASVVYNNNHLKVIELNRILNEYNIIDYREKRHENGLPSYIEYLLGLSNEELINYEFKTDNSNLII